MSNDENQENQVTETTETNTKPVNIENVAQLQEVVSDVEVVGNGDLFQLISKASSKEQGWMKSTKAMETDVGCVVQVTTQYGDQVAEALTFVPGVRIGKVGNNKALVRI